MYCAGKHSDKTQQWFPVFMLICGQDIASPRKQKRPELSQKEKRRVLRDAQKEP